MRENGFSQAKASEAIATTVANWKVQLQAGNSIKLEGVGRFYYDNEDAICFNQSLESNFDLDAFAHRAYYNEDAGRIEMHLMSLAEQQVSIEDQHFNFAVGETILSEVSYKYTVPGFERMVSQAGFRVEKVWTDPNNLFSVQYMVVN